MNNNNKMNEFCKENQFVAWFETSAKDNINIEEAANCLVAKVRTPIFFFLFSRVFCSDF